MKDPGKMTVGAKVNEWHNRMALKLALKSLLTPWTRGRIEINIEYIPPRSCGRGAPIPRSKTTQKIWGFYCRVPPVKMTRFEYRTYLDLASNGSLWGNSGDHRTRDKTDVTNLRPAIWRTCIPVTECHMVVSR
jgi:hypothetical protein